VAIIPSQSWDEVEPRATELLSVCERQGPDGARAWLDKHGIEWWRPTGLSDHLRRIERPARAEGSVIPRAARQG